MSCPIHGDDLKPGECLECYKIIQTQKKEK